MSQAPIASVDICNLALDILHHEPISSLLNPGDVDADICARWYDQVRRLLIRKYVFNFSRKTVLLTPNANAPAHPEFINGYSLPADFVRLLKLGDRILWGGAIPTQFFDFSGGFLYCDDLTDQGTGLAQPAATLQVNAIYNSGSTFNGVPVPYGTTLIGIQGGTPIPGAQYTISGVVGEAQVNGNVYQIVPGTLNNHPCFYLQTASGVNFNSSNYGVYTSGGFATATYIPPGLSASPVGLECVYIFDAQNVLQFDPAFLDLMVLQLAARMCKKLTGKDPSQILLAQLANAELAAAATAGQEKPPVRVQRSRIRDVRRSGGIFRNNTIVGGWGP